MFQGMEYVYEVYKEKSFSKAAQNLYVSQPALSATIKKIEKGIGMPIFDRSTYPIQLTECGIEYVKCIEKIMDLENGFYNYINNLNDLKVGKITIGSNNIYASYILPPIIAEFTKKFPHIEVRLVEANTDQLEQHLISGHLDLVIDNHDFDEKLYGKHFIFHETLLLMSYPNCHVNKMVEKYQLTMEDVLKGKHLESTTQAVPLKLFSEESFVLLKTGNDSRARINRICSENGFTPKVVLELDQLATAYNIASYGMGNTVISDTLVKKVPLNSHSVFYKLDNSYSRREVYFFNKHGKYVTRAVDEFLKIATKRKSEKYI